MKTLDAILAAEDRLADADITAAIEQLFITNKGVTSHLLDVRTQQGIVELTGSTDNLLSRERAEEIALAVRGVRAVVNELQVHAPEVPDADLQTNINRALADDPATTGYGLRCTARAGVVQVEGSLHTWAEKQLALRVLKSVRGVREVNSAQLLVTGRQTACSDTEITTQIREYLDWDIRVNSALVDIRTAEGVVHLTGTVGTAAERARIVATAYTAGARRVDARDLLVAFWALGRELRRDKFAPKTDEAVAAAVRDAFLFDPRVLSCEPTVRVREGIVTLTGAVGNLRARRAAEQDARHVVGVWDVHNLLKVRPAQPLADKEIQQLIIGALGRDPYLARFAFVVNVHHGRAFLYGTVDTHFEQAQAEEVAAGVNGVVELINRVQLPVYAPTFWSAAVEYLSVPETLLSPDHVLEERIRRRFFWSSGLHDQDLEVVVENGRATLTGTVDTWLDRKQAGQFAYEAGARDVNNHLRVASAQPARNSASGI